MFLVLIDSNGKRVDDRVWELADAKAALAALEECGCGVHLAYMACVQTLTSLLFLLYKRNGTDFGDAVCVRASARR